MGTGGSMLWRRGKAYSQDLRERVFAEADEGARVGQIAVLLRVSVSYVSKVLSRRRISGETAARPQRCHVSPKLRSLHEALRAEVAARPDATLAELQDWLSSTHKVAASLALLSRTLSGLGLTRKKSRFGPASRRVRMSLRRARHGATSRLRSILAP
jgi:transposase